MNEHDDDLEPEVQDGTEFEVEEFPFTEEDEGTDVSGEQGATQMELDIDPDKSEI